MDITSLPTTPETRLVRIGITLPDAAPKPIGSFRNVRVSGGMIYVSGQGPVRADGSLIRGKVGAEISAEEARDHARLVAINILSGGQQDISARFASRVGDRFKGIDWFRGLNGLPVIRGTIATFECRRTEMVEAGDHVVFFGEVEDCEQCDLEPLVFFAGQYGTTRNHG